MKSKLVLIGFFSLIFSITGAQTSQVLYFLNLPQNNLLNPSFRPASRIYVGFPGLAGINTNISNNFFNFSDVFTKGLEVSEYTLPFLDPSFNPEDFLSRVKKINYFEPEVSVQLLGVGFTVRNDLYLFLDVNERTGANIIFPRDLVRLAFLGNQDFTGETFDLKPLRAEALSYHEIGFGFSKKIIPKLRIGARGKILVGIAAGSLRNEALNLTVNNDLTNRLVADIRMKVSGPLTFNLDQDNKLDEVKFDDSRFNTGNGFYFNGKNLGLGVDLGAEYELTDQIVLSASVTDLGYIRWKSDISNLKAQGNVDLQGIDFEDIRTGSSTLSDLSESLIDSLKNYLVFTKTQEAFTTFTPVGLALSGKYVINDKFSAGILSYTKIVDKHVREAITLSGNFNIGNILTTGLTFTASNRSYSSLGLGLGVRAGFAQFYFLADRLPLKWSRVSDGHDGSIALPANWHTINGMFGINFVFGNREAKKRKDTSQEE
jgi:hypothetical protein